MGKSVAITVRVDSETSAQLEALAAATERSKSFLASKAVSEYAAKETAIMAGIEAGIKDRDAGRVIPHGEVMDNIDRIIAQWGPGKS